MKVDEGTHIQYTCTTKGVHTNMPRIARLVVLGMPHHITQRGNRCQRVFFGDRDKKAYLEILKAQCRCFGVTIWSYCLMDNHVHFIAIPENKESLGQAFGQTHRYYTRMINFREGWRGYLWQGRFLSYVMDEAHLYAAVRYIETNPVKAAIVSKAEDYPWSSARARVLKLKDELASDFFLIREITDWSGFLASATSGETKLFESHLTSSKPIGSEEFIVKLEKLTGRVLRRLKSGPKPKQLLEN